MTITSTVQVDTPSDREVRVTRGFNAPQNLVFQAWTQPEFLRRWLLGPPGWSLEVCEVDLRVGGVYRFVWSGPDGESMGMGGTYREVLPPQRFVSDQTYDEDWTGGETIVTTELTEDGAGTISTTTMLYSSREARDGALATGMAEGMGMGYERLDALLAELA